MLPLHRLPPAPEAPPCTLLAGVRVLDLTTSIAAPYATLLLADLGADVAKIERPGRGDDSRAWGPPFLDGESLWYLSVNRNKASVTLDYARPEGLAVLHRLVAVSDVVVLNLVPRVQKKLRVDRETLRALNPNLVFVSITGFGLEGARADKTSYDIVAEGFSGVMDLTGEPENPPQKVGTPAADLLSGMDAVIGALAALYDRAKKGRGHTIDVSMFESMARFLTPRVVTYLGSGEVPRRSGGKDSVIAIYQAFDTADEPITLGLGNDGLWRRFWEAIGDPAFGDDPRFVSNADRHAARAEIVAHIQTRLLTQPRAHWLDLLDAAGIPCGPINRIDQMVEDPELLARGFLYRMEDNGRSIPQVGLGIGIDGAACGPRRAPPVLGADTRDVLSGWIGLDDAEFDRLSRQGVI